MALLVPAVSAAVALAAILLYRWLRLLSARRRAKRGVAFIVHSAASMEEGQALLSPKISKASPPTSHPASPTPATADGGALALALALCSPARLPAPVPAKSSSPRSQKHLVSIARARAMIESFGLPFEPLAELLRNLGGIVAGGSMVHAYMAQPPAQFIGDLDIFCEPAHVKPLRALLKAAGYRHTSSAVDGYAAPAAAGAEGGSECGTADAAAAAAAGYPIMLLESGASPAPATTTSPATDSNTATAAATGYDALLNSLFNSLSTTGSATATAAGATATASATAIDATLASLFTTNASATDAGTSPSHEELLVRYQLLRHLLRVDDFVHPETGRKVQLVVCRDPQAAPAHFDLSAAATVFDGSSLYTLYPATTDKWAMFWLHYGDPRGPGRLAKYESRGFKLVPCPEGLCLPPSNASKLWASQYHPAGEAATTG